MQKVKINKDKWFKTSQYSPHPGQLRLHNSQARFRVVIAGRRWGKSLAAAKEAETMILTPGTRGWVVSKTYDLTKKVIREIYKDLIMKHRIKPIKNQMSGPIVLEFPWGSTLEGKSAEHPESLLGEGLDWLIFDECAISDAKVWEQYLRPTLTDREGWGLFITTPNGYNWVYDLWKRGYDPDYPEWESFKSPSWENPHLSVRDIEEARRTMQEAVFMQEYGAEFTLSSGQVYKEFDITQHVIPESQLYIHPDWSKFRSIDFGYENPFVCLYITVDPEDRIIIYDEYYQRHRTLEYHAKMLNQVNTKFDYTTCDPSGASARATLLEYGIPTIAERSDILNGLEIIRQYLRIREDGTPGLYVSSGCTNTIKEFTLYSYPGGGNMDDPVKEYDHCMDALRYFAVHWRKGYIKQIPAIYI